MFLSSILSKCGFASSYKSRMNLWGVSINCFILLVRGPQFAQINFTLLIIGSMTQLRVYDTGGFFIILGLACTLKLVQDASFSVNSPINISILL